METRIRTVARTALALALSLMLTGVVRSGAVASTDYREFIDQVLRAPR